MTKHNHDEPIQQQPTNPPHENVKNTLVEEVKTTEEQHAAHNRLYIFGVICNIIAHILFGTDPVLSRYLQRNAKLSAMMILILSHLVALAIYSPRAIYLIYRSVKRRYTTTRDPITLKTVHTRIWNILVGYWLIYAFGIFVTLRLVGAMYASRFTSATFVQLIMLLMPFMVVFIGYFLINEKITKSLILGMIFIIIGGVLVVMGSFNQSRDSKQYKFYWTINFKSLAQNFSKSDIIGLVIALLSTISLAFMNIVVRGGSLIISMSDEEASSSKAKGLLKRHTYPCSTEDFFLTQMVLVPLVLIIPSVILDDWTLWKHMSGLQWGVFFIHSVLVTLVASQLSFVGMQVLGAANASSILALRLVSAVVLGGFVLGEYMNNIFQIVGCVIVLVAVTGFLVLQRKQPQKPDSLPQDLPPQESNTELQEDPVTRTDPPTTTDVNDVKLSYLEDSKL